VSDKQFFKGLEMKLITSEILKMLPRIGVTGDLSTNEVKVPLKIFNPYGGGTWYITEYDPEEGLAFGYANIIGGEFAELGYIDMNELINFRTRSGLGLERDAYFGFDHTLEEVMESLGTI